MMTPNTRQGPARPWRLHAKVLAALATTGALLLGGTVPAAHAVDQLPGVILRAYNMGQSIGGICELTPGQTPNVDKPMTNINWQSDAQFGLTDFFITHAFGNITVPTTGNYNFRLTADENGRLMIDGNTVIASAGSGGATATVNLTAGLHTIRVEHYEDYWGQNLKLDWQKPGDAGYTVVPASAFSYDDETMAHVTAPGIKTCINSEDTPGDGLPLDQVNPIYDLTDLRADAWQPQVTGLAWLDADTLIVTTWGGTITGSTTGNGHVYLLDGVVGDDIDAETVTRTLIADDMFEPMGVIAVDGKIYVTEKHQLLELSDTDLNGDWTERTVTTFPYGGNYHEFAFGLLYKDGFFYLNLSVGIGNGGNSSNPQSSTNRGTHVKVNAATGEKEYVAGGLRTPNGMAWTSEGSILVADNQGDWLPASKLVEIKEDGFYNHYNTPAGPYDTQPVVRPIVWFPQNEIGNSTSQPVELTEGPFAGQILAGDVTYGGLQRVSIQEVDGVKQGAVFRHTQGLESGINRTILGPDGDIYFGGLGAGGNWGQSNKLRHGLQKLSLNGEDNFDMFDVKLTETGFEIDYTKPISDATLATIEDAYTISQWRYAPTNSYGGPKLNQVQLTPSNVEVSEDKKTVTFDVDGLLENRVVHIQSDRPFSAADGQTLWSTETWYTINEIPGYVEPPVVPSLSYEMENGTQSGNSGVASEHAGFTGTGFVDDFVPPSSTSGIQVNVAEAGSYSLALRYAAGTFPNTAGRTARLYVNGTDVGQQTFPNTGAWTVWGTQTATINLNAGSNTIEYRATSSDTGYINLDNIKLTLLTASSLTIEAETGTVSGGAGIDTEHAGFSGDAFVDGFELTGATVNVPVTVATAGQYDVVLRYGAGQYGQNPDSRTTHVTVNDGASTLLTLPTASTWTTWLDSAPFRVTLAAGANTIKFHNVAGDTGFINFDRLNLVAVDDPDPEPEPVVQTFYQWELGTKTASENASAFGGYSGTGYVTGLDANSKVSVGIAVEEAGEYDLAFRYANGAAVTAAEPTGTVVVNDADAGELSFPSTIANWAKWGTERITVELGAGANTIEYEALTGTVNLDLVSVRPHDEPITLFDGNGLANWQNVNGNPANWTLVDDTMAVAGGNIRTLEGFKDFRLETDFWLPVYGPEVTGQNRANSGIYFQERYEVQVLDSFGLQLQTNDAGAIYLQKKADVNAATAPGTWQNYVIEFTAARWENGVKVSLPRITAWWNGQKIHDNVAVTGSTTVGEPEGPATGGIMLQDHGSPVKYRDMTLEFIEPAVAPPPTPSLVYEAENGIRSGTGIATNHAGYSGTGFVDVMIDNNDSVRLDLFVEHAGEYKTTLRYGAGSYGQNAASRTFSIKVNGGEARTVTVPATALWSTWLDYVENVELVEGANTIEYIKLPANTGYVNFDLLTLEFLGEEPDETDPTVDATVDGRTVTLTAEDTESGVASIEYQLPGDAGWTVYSAPFAVPGTGLVTVSYRATDVAGNVSEVETVDVPAVVDPGDVAVDRVEGATRYEGAVSISQAAYPDTAPVVYVTSGENYPDALSAGPAAAHEGGPLLLVQSNSLPAVVSAEIARLDPAKIVVVGGTLSVTEEVFNELDALTEEIVRISGDNRYQASRNVADYAFGDADVPLVYIATGEKFPDALAAGGAAGSQDAPVLLVKGSAPSLDAETLALLDEFNTTDTRVLGGEESVTPGILAELDAITDAIRLGGTNRYEAARAINADAFDSADRAFIATGQNFPDALAGSAWAAAAGSPLFVVPGSCVTAGVLADLDALGVTQVTLLGGEASLSPEVFSLTSCG